MAKKPRVAIIGRANVGKSTLFNRLSSGPRALVSDIAGTTRDRNEQDCHWRGSVFTVVDTGGLDTDAENALEQRISEQARKALSTAKLILFVIDAKAGITPRDRAIADELRELKKNILLVANKVDGDKDVQLIGEFYSLGFNAPWPVSSVSGAGSGDLLDEIVRCIKPSAQSEAPSIKVAIIGKPNVGKSTLLNGLIGEERAIVSPEPYTTRDANEIPFSFDGTAMTLIDTAGIRKKSRIDPKSIEIESTTQSLMSIRKADVVVFVTEANKPITAQDRQLAQLIHDSRAAVVIIGNKWDMVEDKQENMTKYTQYYKRSLNFINWAPLIFLSAKNKTKLTALKKMIIAVQKEKFRLVNDNALNKFLKVIIRRHKPTRGKGVKQPYIYRMKQIDINPPQFVVQITHNTSLSSAYVDFIEKQLRLKFGYIGSPIKIWIEKVMKTKKI